MKQVVLTGIRKMAMNEINEESRKRSIPLLNTGFVNKIKEEYFLEKNMPYYSFEEIFKNMKMIEYGYNPKNTTDHFDERGNDFIGEQLAVKIKLLFNL